MSIINERYPIKSRKVYSDLNQEELRDKIISRGKRLAKKHNVSAVSLEDYVRVLFIYDLNLRNDLKLIVHSDAKINTQTSCGKDNGNGEALLGFHNLKGFIFLGVEIYHNDDLPVFVILYTNKVYDSELLRAYTPRRGNPINLDWDCAIGAEEIYMHEAIREWAASTMKKEYIDAGVYDENQTWAQMYCNKQGIELKDICYDWAAITFDVIKKFSL